MKLISRWKTRNGRWVYLYQRFMIIGNNKEGWNVLLNSDVNIHDDGTVEFDPYADFGTFDKLVEAIRIVKDLETALERGHKIIMEYHGPRTGELGAGYGSVLTEPETGGTILSYPRKYPARAAHEWGHIYIERHGLQPKTLLGTEQQASRYAIHALKARGQYTPAIRKDYISALASFYTDKDSKTRRAKATRFIDQVEKESPLPMKEAEEWEKEWEKGRAEEKRKRERSRR